MDKNWLDYQRYAVWGLGRSGKAAANLLVRHGKTVIASDSREADALSDDVLELDDRVEWHGGGNIIGHAEVIVTSPGLRPGLDVFEDARRQGVPVISEVDLAFDVSSSAWIAITGTDGKTTTTSLAGEMLDAAGITNVVGGNIGTALCDLVDDIDADTVVVAEISANQLWSCHHLSVTTAAITNIAADHLDYFDDFAEYPRAKHRLVKLQRRDAETILPVDDIKLRDVLADHCQQGLTLFAGGADDVGDASRIVYFDDAGVGRWRENGEEGQWFDDFSEVALIGFHNQRNAACAAAMARSVGASWDGIAAGLRGFSSLPHRMQPVATVDDVLYIDDSKATNAHASLAGLKGVKTPMVVIAGGRDKGLELEEWADEVADRAERIVLIGEITARMADLLEERGATVDRADSVESAVDVAHKQARPGSTIVLSPACSSYDMFANYKERGRAFQNAVSRLSSLRE